MTNDIFQRTRTKNFRMYIETQKILSSQSILRKKDGAGGIRVPDYTTASLVAQLVKNLPTMQETWVQSLGWEDPLKEGTATHSSILAWIIPWTEEPGGLWSIRLQRVGHD